MLPMKVILLDNANKFGVTPNAPPDSNENEMSIDQSSQKKISEETAQIRAQYLREMFTFVWLKHFVQMVITFILKGADLRLRAITLSTAVLLGLSVGLHLLLLLILGCMRNRKHNNVKIVLFAYLIAFEMFYRCYGSLLLYNVTYSATHLVVMTCAFFLLSLFSLQSKCQLNFTGAIIFVVTCFLLSWIYLQVVMYYNEAPGIIAVTFYGVFNGEMYVAWIQHSMKKFTAQDRLPSIIAVEVATMLCSFAALLLLGIGFALCA